MSNCLDCGGSECVCSLRAENRRLREQLVSVVTGVLAGCSGVTIETRPGRELRDRRGRSLASRLVHRCLLEQRLQAVLAEHAGPKPVDGVRSLMTAMLDPSNDPVVADTKEKFFT